MAAVGSPRGCFAQSMMATKGLMVKEEAWHVYIP